MPPRWLSFIIIAAWLGVTGWMAYTQVLPHLMPGRPPAFFIDPLDETNDKPVTTRWTAERGGVRTFAVTTHVAPLGDGLFEMGAAYTPHGNARGDGGPVRVGNLLVSRMTSAYRVNMAGDLLGLRVKVEGKREALGMSLPFAADVVGDVERGRLSPTLTMNVGTQELRLPLAEVEVPRGGAALMPLHPVNRIRGLAPGRRWVVPLFDPFPVVSSAGQGLGGPPTLTAGVRAEVETFTHGRRKSVPCHVVDYDGDDGVTATTWVATRTELVLKQESTRDGETWTLYRE